MKMQMIRIVSGQYKDVMGYMSFDENIEGIVNFKVGNEWFELPENSVEFESICHSSESRGDTL